MSNYFLNKDENIKKAINHTKEMAEKYKEEITLSVNHSCIFDDYNFSVFINENKSNTPNIIVEDIDSVSAIFKYHDNNTAVLNFASYKNPGGMFFEGSSAQEESLCHESNLYNVLNNFNDTYYAYNNTHLNKGLYLGRALITPNIIFERTSEEPVKCSVITCAAPNYLTAHKYQRITRAENNKVLRKRIEFIYNITEKMKFSTLILGAFGCGVFGQDSFTTAEYFREFFKNSSAKNIIFAIPPGPNFNAFKFIFS